ncbi:phage protein Gp36 family protein [Chryseobacterium sp. CCH4-E10]|uniref:phage protein Gp36 family protein n=1 Tax=Chryseobacterium sp. CCH4-E10 TaxID=1768758 RepID=UPI00082DDC6C|nr:phage protein Gp36 family protein [Chryseobacterium sp. CCH4-E10]
MFITDDDYSVLVREEIKDILLENYSETKLRAAEQMAIDQVKNYLSGKYDTGEIFSRTGDARNSHIVMITLDCALYHLYTPIPRKMPETRAQRYQDAIDWLKLVAKGEGTADLPKIKNESGETLSGIRFTSKYTAENNRW